jgi:predicted phosphodiesterase
MFGVIADIHGNAWALEAVISDAHRRGVSEFVNLGDGLYGPRAPRKTFELLMQINLVAQVRAIKIDPFLIAPNPMLDWVRNDLGS